MMDEFSGKPNATEDDALTGAACDASDAALRQAAGIPATSPAGLTAKARMLRAELESGTGPTRGDPAHALMESLLADLGAPAAPTPEMDTERAALIEDVRVRGLALGFGWISRNIKARFGHCMLPNLTAEQLEEARAMVDRAGPPASAVPTLCSAVRFAPGGVRMSGAGMAARTLELPE